MSLVTLSLVLFSIFFDFEEFYCWNQGVISDPTGKEFVVATREDAKLLKSWNAVEGKQISVSFRAHMLCHTSFKFTDVIKGSYISN